MKLMSSSIREVILGVIVVLLGSGILVFANIPNRITVLENQFASMDRKLDAIIERLK